MKSKDINNLHPPRLITLALLAATFGLPTQVMAEPAATDRGLNDYRQTKNTGPLVPAMFSHLTPMSDDHLNNSMPALPVVKRWQVGSRDGTGPFGTPGWLTPFSAGVHPDGVHVWNASAEGDGFSHVHVVNRFTGEIVFETDPYDIDNPDAPDSGPSSLVVGSYFVVDIDGNVYLQDDRYTWSWDPQFNLRFRTRHPVVPNANGEPTQIAGNAIGTVLLLNNGLIGGATNDGFWLFLDRLTGEVVVAEAMVNPTPIPVPCEPALQAIGLLAGLTTGELSVEASVKLTCGAFGRGIAVSESNSLDPATDFLYQYVGSEDTDNRFVVQYQLVDDVNNPGKKTVETRNVSPPLPPGGATTPTLSLTAGTVIVADGEGAFQAFSIEDMSLVWKTGPGNEAALSPALDQFGNLVAADRFNLYKFDANSGEVLWKRNYDELAVGVLPEQRPYPLLVPDGTPKAMLTSVQVTSPEEYQTTITFGYKIENPGVFLPENAVTFPIPFVAGYALTDPETGDNLGVSVTDFEGASVDTGQIPSADGWVTGQLTDVFANIGSQIFNDLLPPRFKFPGPKFGAYALETASHKANVLKRLDECLLWNKEASKNLKKDPQRAFDVARRCVPALTDVAMQREVRWAARDNEITAEKAGEVVGYLQVAQAAQEQAKAGLLADFYSKNAVSAALRAADSAMKSAKKALEKKKG